MAPAVRERPAQPARLDRHLGYWWQARRLGRVDRGQVHPGHGLWGRISRHLRLFSARPRWCTGLSGVSRVHLARAGLRTHVGALACFLHALSSVTDGSTNFVAQKAPAGLWVLRTISSTSCQPMTRKLKLVCTWACANTLLASAKRRYAYSTACTIPRHLPHWRRSYSV